jgi:CPA1 family monovalent cation:H+ antiporter
MVIMGLFIGNYKENLAMSVRTKDYVYKFWELVDVILNAILFILIGMVIIVIDFKMQYIFIGILSVLMVLFSRIIVVFLPKIFLPRTMNFTKREAKFLVWGGLRGGLSIALVLSLPNSEAKNILLIATYFCVVFSILIQGLTIKKMAMLVK